MKHLAVEWNRHGPGSLHDPVSILFCDFGHAVAHGDGAPAVETANVFTRDACKHCLDLNTCHQFGLVHGPPYRLHSLFRVDDSAPAQAIGRSVPVPDDLDAFRSELRDGNADFRRSEIQSDHRVPASHGSTAPLPTASGSRGHTRPDDDLTLVTQIDVRGGELLFV